MRPTTSVRCVRLLAAGALVVLSTGAAGAQPAAPMPLNARIQAIDTPAALDRGEVATAILDVRNTGSDAWPADGDVRLSYHWTRGDGSTVVGGGRRAHLSTVVAPGQTIRLCAALEAPDEAGLLRLEWDLVKEGVAWFSHRDAGSLLRQEVRVRDAAAAPARGRPGAFAAWLLASAAHLIVSVAWAVRRRPPERASLDARLFDFAVFALGTLHGVLFTASVTTGLAAGRGIAWLAAFDLLVALGLWKHRRDQPIAAGAAGTPDDGLPAAPRSRVTRALQVAGAIALLTFAVSWTRNAARSLHVSGSDAAHYHVPNAVNLALGASPFDLMPTPHAYPMGHGLIGAWFVLPGGDPWLIDLAMLLFFALLAAALCRAFERLTGQPGLAWVPWLLLLVMGTPLFQHASLFSADLPFAAAWAAAVAQILDWRSRPGLTLSDAILGGLAFGLLCGVKTTGVPMTVMLLGIAGGIWAVRRFPRRMTLRTGVLAAGLAAWLAGGGLWLVRNQVEFGSPVAPSGLKVGGVTIFRGETLAESASYYSVAGDMAATPGYPLRQRVVFYVRRLLAPLALPVTGLLLVLLIGDVAITWWRRRTGVGPPDPRPALIAGGVLVAAVFLWLLAHAPWSSLDWTKGLSLRYALPILVGVAFVAWLGLFPRSATWYEDAVPAAVGGLCLIGLAVTRFLQVRALVPDTSPDALPGLDWGSCAIATGLLAAGWLAARVRLARLTAAAVLIAAAWPVSARLAARDAGFVAEAAVEERRLVRCFAAGVPAELDRHRAIQVALLASEGRRDVSCPRRRVFLGAAFDLPLELQSMPYSTLVFEARQASADPAAALDAGDGPCDYLVVTRAELETTRGSRLLQRAGTRQAWTEVAEGGGFVAFATSGPVSASK